MAREVGGVDPTAWRGVLNGRSTEDTGAAKPEETLHGGAELTAQDVAHGLAELGVANEQNKKTAEMVTEQPLITVGLCFQAGDIEMLCNHGIQATLGQIGLPADQLVVAKDFA